MKIFYSEGFIKYLKNTSWLLFERAIRMFLTLFVGIYVARYLGPEKYGLLNYVISFVGLFLPLSSLGIDEIVVRDLVHKPFKVNEILGTAFIMRLIGSVVSVLIIIIICQFSVREKYISWMILLVALGMIFQAFHVITLYFQSVVKSKYTVYAQIIQLTISSSLKIYGVVNNYGLFFFVSILLVESIIFAVSLLAFYLQQNLSFLSWSVDYRMFKNFFKHSLPLMFSGVLVSLYLRIDQIMIKHYIGNREVGQYAAAVNISEVFYFIPMIVTSSLFPAIINAKNNNVTLYSDRIKSLYRLMIAISVCSSIIVTFFSDWIIHLLFGNDFGDAGRILTIHMWASIFVFLGVVSGKWLLLEGLYMLSFYRALVGAIINILSNYILIPYYGAIGAAVSTVFSYFITVFCMIFISNDIRIKENIKLMIQSVIPGKV